MRLTYIPHDTSISRDPHLLIRRSWNWRPNEGMKSELRYLFGGAEFVYLVVWFVS